MNADLSIKRLAPPISVYISYFILYFIKHPSVFKGNSIISFLSLDDSFLKPKLYNDDLLSY